MTDEDLIKCYEKNKHIIMGMVNRYCNDNKEDYYEVGKIALIKAIMKYDSKTNVPIEKYIGLNVKNAIKNEQRKYWNCQNTFERCCECYPEDIEL